MLILTRRPSERLIIDDGNGNEIEVAVLGINGNQVRIGVNAPKHIAVHRQEIHRRIQAEKASA